MTQTLPEQLTARSNGEIWNETEPNVNVLWAVAYGHPNATDRATALVARYNAHEALVEAALLITAACYGCSDRKNGICDDPYAHDALRAALRAAGETT